MPLRALRVVPRRLLLLGLAGTTLLAFGGIGAGAGATAARKDAVAALLHLTWLQLSPAGRSLSLALALLGITLLAAAWWRLRHELERMSPRTLLAITAIWSLPLILGPPHFSRHDRGKETHSR